MTNPNDSKIAACDEEAERLISRAMAGAYSDDALLGFTAAQNRESDLRRLYLLGGMRMEALAASIAWQRAAEVADGMTPGDQF